MKGIGVSPGIAIGRACIIKNIKAEVTGVLLKNEADVSANINKFDEAVNLAVNEIDLIKTNPDLTLHEEDIAILDTQIEFLSDPQLREDVVEKITADKKNVSDALLEAVANMVLIFRDMDDEYMKARAADIQDIGNRILKHLIKSKSGFRQAFEPDTIIIADESLAIDELLNGKVNPKNIIKVPIIKEARNLDKNYAVMIGLSAFLQHSKLFSQEAFVEAINTKNKPAFVEKSLQAIEVGQKLLANYVVN